MAGNCSSSRLFTVQTPHALVFNRLTWKDTTDKSIFFHCGIVVATYLYLCFTVETLLNVGHQNGAT